MTLRVTLHTRQRRGGGVGQGLKDYLVINFVSVRMLSVSQLGEQVKLVRPSVRPTWPQFVLPFNSMGTLIIGTEYPVNIPLISSSPLLISTDTRGLNFCIIKGRLIPLNLPVPLYSIH